MITFIQAVILEIRPPTVTLVAEVDTLVLAPCLLDFCHDHSVLKQPQIKREPEVLVGNIDVADLPKQRSSRQ